MIKPSSIYFYSSFGNANSLARILLVTDGMHVSAYISSEKDPYHGKKIDPGPIVIVHIQWIYDPLL